MKTVNRAIKYGVLAVVAISASVAGAVAYAEKQEAGKTGAENDAMAVAKAKVSLVQAVAVAEQHLNGKASRAEYERTRQGDAYDIEVVSGDKVFDVRVDADKGVILSSALDKADGKGEREDREEKD